MTPTLPTRNTWFRDRSHGNTYDVGAKRGQCRASFLVTDNQNFWESFVCVLKAQHEGSHAAALNDIVNIRWTIEDR